MCSIEYKDDMLAPRRLVMKNVRMQFDLPEDRLDELDSLMKKCGISTKKELVQLRVNNA